MNEKENYSIYRDFIINILQYVGELYWTKMIHYVKDNNIKANELTGFLLNPEKLVINIGRTHIAIEYYGKEKLDKIEDEFLLPIEIHDYSKDKESDFFEKVIGIEFDSTLDIKLPLMVINEDLIIPTNRGADKLFDLKWNFAAQNSITGLNIAGYFVPEASICETS